MCNGQLYSVFVQTVESRALGTGKTLTSDPGEGCAERWALEKRLPQTLVRVTQRMRVLVLHKSSIRPFCSHPAEHRLQEADEEAVEEILS